MYITKKKNHDSPTMLCLILKLEGLSGAHDAHVRFKGKNLCLKTILNILRTSAISKFRYTLGASYIIEEVL